MQIWQTTKSKCAEVRNPCVAEFQNLEAGRSGPRGVSRLILLPEYAVVVVLSVFENLCKSPCTCRENGESITGTCGRKTRRF